MDRFESLGIDWNDVRGQLAPELFARLDPEKLLWVLDEVPRLRGFFPGATVRVGFALPTTVEGEVTVLEEPNALVVLPDEPLAGVGIDDEGREGTEFIIGSFDVDGVAAIYFGPRLAALVSWTCFLGRPEDYSVPVE